MYLFERMNEKVEEKILKAREYIIKVKHRKSILLNQLFGS